MCCALYACAVRRESPHVVRRRRSRQHATTSRALVRISIVTCCVAWRACAAAVGVGAAAAAAVAAAPDASPGSRARPCAAVPPASCMTAFRHHSDIIQTAFRRHSDISVTDRSLRYESRSETTTARLSHHARETGAAQRRNDNNDNDGEDDDGDDDDDAAHGAAVARSCAAGWPRPVVWWSDLPSQISLRSLCSSGLGLRDERAPSSPPVPPRVTPCHLVRRDRRAKERHAGTL